MTREEILQKLENVSDTELEDLINKKEITLAQQGTSIQITIIKEEISPKEMDIVIVKIHDKEYSVQIAETDELKQKGLQGITELPSNKGMLFLFEGEPCLMWMKDTKIPLDQVFLDEDYKVIKVITREPEDETLMSVRGTYYVLEVNANSGIKKGDELEFDEDDDSVMKVLAPDGSTQMPLWGGERIFSRKNTKVLIRQAKKAYNSKSNSDYKRLGKSMFKYLSILDTNTPEYVEAPD